MLKLVNVENGIRVEIKVQPRAARNQVVGVQEGMLKIKLTAPPVDGEANQELIDYLARILKIAKKNISIIRGDTSRTKLLEIKGIDQATFQSKIGLS